MSVSLNHLNISLDQFNAAASGKYNIGQLKLDSDGTGVVRTNNHKTLTFFNDTRIAPEESIAIKCAFCKALKKEGLSAEALADVRGRLGLAHGVVVALHAGNVQPLSAAEVRDIIDTYAGQINAARAPGRARLRTSAELYRGVSATTIAERQDIRGEINADSAERMDTRASAPLDRFIDILSTFGQRVDWPADTKRMAVEMLRAIARGNVLDTSGPGSDLELTSAPITLMRARNGKILAKIELPDGNTFSVSTEQTRDELFKHLNRALGTKLDAVDNAKANKPAPPPAPASRPAPSAREAIATLKEVVSVVKDSAKMAKLKAQILPTLHKEGKHGPYTDAELDLHASHQARAQLTDSVVNQLVPALRKARGHDERNAGLVNRFRAFVDGDKTIDPDALVEDITRALAPPRRDPILRQIDDDFDKPLNINAILGNA